jgi:uncharacterized protein YndB with AHSA1/START domain
MTVRIAVSVDVAAEPDDAFAALVDLPSQEKWIIATRLYAIEGPVSPPHVGARLAAFTGVGSIGFLDTMTVTAYEPPHRWVMDKDGDLLRGVGTMQVDPLPAGGCRVTWANDLRLPFGVVGRAGWLIAKPIAQLALGASLRRLARQLTAGALPLRPAPARLPVGGGPGS